MFQSRKGKRKHLFSTFHNNSTQKPINIALDRNQLLYPVKEKDEMCDYNKKRVMSLGLIIDDIIMDSFMNAAYEEKSSLTITCFPKYKKEMLLCTNRPFKTICGNSHQRKFRSSTPTPPC